MATATQTIAAAEAILAEAQSKLTDRASSLREAKAQIESIEAAWRRGDDSIPATAKIEAEAEVKRLTLLHAAAEKAVTQASRKAKSLDPILAEKVAHALSDSIYGVKAEAVRTAPTTSSKTPKVFVTEVGERKFAESSINLRNSRVAEAASGGALAGDIEMVVTGPAYMAAFDTDGLLDRLRQFGVQTDFNRTLTVSQRGSGVFSTKFRVTSAVPLMPVIPHAEWDRHEPSAGIFLDQESAQMNGKTVVNSADSRLVNEAIDHDGLRRITLDVSMTVRSTTASETPNVAKRANAFLESQYPIGGGFQHLGTVESVDLTTAGTSVDVAQGSKRVPVGAQIVTARVAFVSKATA